MYLVHIWFNFQSLVEVWCHISGPLPLQAFCSDIVNGVICSWSVESDGSDDLSIDEIDEILQVVQELFGFENISRLDEYIFTFMLSLSSWIRMSKFSFIRSSVYIVPFLLLTNQEIRPISVKFLDRIRFHLSKHRKDLISEVGFEQILNSFRFTFDLWYS